jgi:hypothetical protein
MARDKEAFLSRWSRLKRKPEAKPQEPQTPAPALPPVESLTPESEEFKSFMHPKVKDALRRAALKKLFSDPHFNIPDPYEAYSGDFTGGEPIPPEMLATLNQAKEVLFREEEKEKEKEKEKQLAEKQETKEPDEPGSKDA